MAKHAQAEPKKALISLDTKGLRIHGGDLLYNFQKYFQILGLGRAYYDLGTCFQD